MVRRRSGLGRRAFVTGMGALGAGVLLGSHATAAQTSTSRHRIDVHHHHTPPAYAAALAAECNDYTS